MIIDNFENLKRYISVNKYFDKAFEYILSTDFSALNVGGYEVDGDNIYANVDEYETKLVSKPEYHKKYIDIQFLVNGSEYIGYTSVENLLEKEEFNEDKDIGFGLGVVDFIKMKPTKFMILFPEDAHQPCMADGKPQKVKKIVVKVKVD